MVGKYPVEREGALWRIANPSQQKKKSLYNENPSIYLDVGLTKVNVTPSPGVGRAVPFCNSVCTAAVQVIVQCLEVVESPKHISYLDILFM